MSELKGLAALAAAGRLSRRDFLGRASALGLTAAAAGTLLSDAALAAGPKKGGDMRVGSIGGESTNSLDPATYASQVPFLNGKCWGDTLVETSPTGDVTPRLAEEVEASSDAKTWRFKIRSGVEFHNGKSLTAEDVLATMQRHSGEDTKSGALGIMRGIESMRTDGDVFEVTLKTANADLPYLMADYHLIIQPDGGVDAPAAGVGTGPYRVESDEPGVRHLYTLNPNYWDPERGHADTVEIRVINDATARISALQSGEVHMINRVEPKIVNLLERVPGVQINNIGGRGHYVFIMHADTAPFDNVDLRMALKLAMNREEMVQKILRGYGTIGHDTPINGAYPLYDAEALETRAYDPDQAAFHFKKSGHDGAVTLRTSDVAFPGAVDAAQLYQQQAAAAGIQIEIKREPGDGYWSEVWNKQPFCTSYWGGRPTQDQMFSTAYLSTADWNDTRFFNERFDSLLLEARAELDLAKRKAMYTEMSMLVQNDGGLICPMFNDFIDATSERVAGYSADPNAELMNGFATSKCWLA
ncbi:MAG: ABC transporter substrate-binding protein [Pseudomonadota bacterium]